MTIDELLNLMEDNLEDAFVVPLTGRRMVNADKMQELIDQMRANLPPQIQKAKAIVGDRDAIVDKARKKADALVQEAEARARVMVNKEEVVKQSQSYAREVAATADAKAKETAAEAAKNAEEVMKHARQQAGEMRHNALRFSEDVLRQTEMVLERGYEEVKAVRAGVLEKSKGK